MADSYKKYMDEKFDVSHVTCPKCKVDLKKHLSTIEVPIDGSSSKKMGVEVTSCPKCGFIGDLDPM